MPLPVYKTQFSNYLRRRSTFLFISFPNCISIISVLKCFLQMHDCNNRFFINCQTEVIKISISGGLKRHLSNLKFYLNKYRLWFITAWAADSAIAWEGLLKAAMIADGRLEDNAEWSRKTPSVSCGRFCITFSEFGNIISGAWRNGCDSVHSSLGLNLHKKYVWI